MVSMCYYNLKGSMVLIDNTITLPSTDFPTKILSHLPSNLISFGGGEGETNNNIKQEVSSWLVLHILGGADF